MKDKENLAEELLDVIQCGYGIGFTKGINLEEEIDKLKKANKELAKLWNDDNRKLWCNNESARQLRKLSEDILISQRIDKNQLASYIYDISMYVGGGVGVELKSKDK